tara:strand:+ start:227 stop:727 length:501 start_codon:yes stop_codon:yes gene_type:complete
MSILNDHKIHAAYFADNDREHITVELIHPDNEKTPDDNVNVFLYTFPAVEGNPDYDNITKYISIDQLHENTVNKFRRDRENFEAYIVDIAKKSNEFTTVTATHGSADFVKSVMDFLDKELNEQDLFTFKLNLFEHESVQESKNRTKKANLRKAKTAKEAFKIFLDF